MNYGNLSTKLFTFILRVTSSAIIHVQRIGKA